MEVQDLLPIGSVVVLKGGNKKLMIIGLLIEDENQKMYDYISVLYPEGFISFDDLFFFNHSDVDICCFKGFECEERGVFLNNIDEEINRMLLKE